MPTAPPAETADLRVGSESFTKESGYDIVSGEVTNISDHAINSCTAVTTFYDNAGNVVKTEDALIDFNPILPGQTSPYKTMGTDNPEIKREKTSFQVFGGEQIATTAAPAPEPHHSRSTFVDDEASDEDLSGSTSDPTSATASAGSGESDAPLSRRMVKNTVLVDADLAGKSLAALSVSYNTIYATHGYIFKRQSLRRIFSGKSWYHPDASFLESDLTSTEKTNLKTIRAYERSHYGY